VSTTAASRGSMAATLHTTTRNFALLGVAAVGNRLLALVLSLALARALGPSVYGIYTFAAAIVLVIVAITDFGLQPYITREVAQDRGRLDASLRGLVAFRLILASVGLLGVAVWFALDPGSELAQAALILYFALSLESGFYIGAAYLQGLETMRFEALTGLIGGLVRTVGGVALIFLSGELNYVLAWMALVALLQAGAVSLKLRREQNRPGRIHPSPIPLRVALASSGAMMIVVVCNALILRADSIVIGAFEGAESVGFYTAAYALVTGVQIVPWILSVAVFPVFSRTFGRDEEQLQAAWAGALRAAALTTIPSAVIITILAEPIVDLLYGSSYAPSAEVLEILIWWVPLAAFTALSAGLLRAVGRERIHALILIAGATLNIVGNLIVVPVYGFLAAAWVTIAVEAAMGLVTVPIIRRLDIRPPTASLVLRIIAALVGLAIATLLLRPLPVEVAVLGAITVFLALAIALRTVTIPEIRSMSRSILGGGRA
jgi:O-antigen/teichoic acid export membrane protein